MPIYEYECRQCGHTFDALQKMSAEPLVDCPACGKAGLQKLVSAPSFKLKGEGWYETDFKTKKDDTKKTATESKTSSSTDSKPAATSDTKSTAAKTGTSDS